jgi:EAL domain-containing protein (putative c-di-GMP-specific phosphodiesterase class I)
MRIISSPISILAIASAISVGVGFTMDPIDANDCAITNAVIALGNALNLTIVAEGVETKAQERFLREHGCNEIQGYLFTIPLPGQEFVAFAREPY